MGTWQHPWASQDLLVQGEELGQLWASKAGNLPGFGESIPISKHIHQSATLVVGLPSFSLFTLTPAVSLWLPLLSPPYGYGN